jgi:hypothetical protein
MGGTIVSLGLKGATGHGLHFMVRVVLQGDVWVLHLGVIGWILLTPLLSKWHDTSLIPVTLTPVLSFLLTLSPGFDFIGGRHGDILVDRFRWLLTHDRRSKVVLQSHPGDDQREHHFWRQWAQ